MAFRLFSIVFLLGSFSSLYSETCQKQKKQKECIAISSCVWSKNNCITKVSKLGGKSRQSIYNPNRMQQNRDEKYLIKDDPRIRGRKPESL